jgi:hypothetical protein
VTDHLGRLSSILGRGNDFFLLAIRVQASSVPTEWLARLFLILEDPVSNLGPQISYPDWTFVDYLSCSRKISGYCVKLSQDSFLPHHGSPTRGLPGCIMRLAATFINYVYSIKITNNVGGYVYHLLLFFHVRPADQPTVTSVTLSHKKFGRPWSTSFPSHC